MKLLETNSIPVPVELATKLREHLKTRASDGAIFLQQLHYWTEQRCGRVIDGVRWIWNTYTGWLDNFKWWSEYDFRIIVKKLRELGLVKFCQPNDHERDRTGHYRLNYEHEWLKPLVDSHPLNSSTDATVSQSTHPSGNCATNIPETTPSTTSNQEAVEKSFPQEKEELVAKYRDQLKYYEVYTHRWEADALMPNPKFEPVLTALRKVPLVAAERAIVAFLADCRTKLQKDLGDKYITLAKAIRYAS